MAAEIDVGHGSIRNHLDKLMAEGFLQGLKTDPKLSDEGFHLLHDFWPDEFSYAEQFKFVQRIDMPFWTSMSTQLSRDRPMGGQPTLSEGFRMSNLDNHLDNSVQVHPP